MTNEKKRKTQYNWKFKSNETDEFYDWFENQDNIALSLRKIVYHMIELYGTESVLNHHVDKEMSRDMFILEALRGKEALTVKESILSEGSPRKDLSILEKTSPYVQMERRVNEEPNKSEAKSKVNYQEVNPKSIF
ncbi:hypothetical protein ACU3L3_14060 [Priestia endophytica]|uniref:Uncharacterized protein n=1 Tax=Priestia endophytica DSM 13796 TaxID=1121089 RepID=A0A1I6BUZ6_9BACI|nr:hypothetical protein [Priestia endophytica]KYG30783.1 hypothetical protein AZF06_23625 [Priestia endophytica]SFQ84677.1 hypothetical protein SAMN02745910_04250 [Priestia endophytica DSM 13796]